MRWERLFEDLEAQLAEEEAGELWAEVADRTRWETSQVGLAHRLRGSLGGPLVAWVPGTGPVRGQLGAVGADWMLVTEESGAEAVLPLAALVRVSGVGTRAEAGDGNRVSERLRLGYMLRAISRDRSEVAVTLVDGSIVRGTIDRVGADHADVSERPGGHRRWTVTFDGIAVVRRSR